MTPEQAKKFFVGGRIVKVRFIKRSNGAERTMICRMGVKKGVSGEGQRYDPETRNLITVFEMKPGQHRTIPTDSILELKSGHDHFIWE